MRILIVGNGGREHALGVALAQSPKQPELFFAPGNAGTARIGTNLEVSAANVQGLLEAVKSIKIDLTVVGPEIPLVAGLTDVLREAGHRVVGPSAAAAQLEGSKAFAKRFMARYGIPTAGYRVFKREDQETALRFIEVHPTPLVVKASGLAAGKGAVVCFTREEALDTVRDMLGGATFGEATDSIVVEEFMQGEEASLFVLTDGMRYTLLAPAQDHKRIGEGDTGLNTGGMGAYAPAPIVTGRILTQVCRDIVEPTLGGMQAEGHPFSGILYVGLMLTPTGPKVVEYNCRLGDPETQAVLPLLDSDLLPVFESIADGSLHPAPIHMKAKHAATVVLASGGYPGPYATGKRVRGLEEAEAVPNAYVFHAGTRLQDGKVYTSGGRVLAVTGLGDTLEDALATAYRAAGYISFEGRYLRRDIGHRATRKP